MYALKKNRTINFINKNNLYRHLFFSVLMFGAIIFAIWKCSYGFGGNDEAFYLTIPHRLLMGDSLFTEEWHVSQFSGFLLMPFVWIYETITKSTDGIIFAMRIIYVLFHFLISIFIYVRLQKFNVMAVVSSLLYFIFTPFDIMALSYNTMAFDLLVFTGVLIATANTNIKISFIICGISFSAVVLCCPYMAVVYILFAVCVLIHRIICKCKNENIKQIILSTDLFSGKNFLLFSVGVAFSIVVFMSFVLSRTSISNIIENLQYILSDPEHPAMSITDKLSMYCKAFTESHPFMCISLIAYLITILILIFDKNRAKHKTLYFVFSTVITIFTYIIFIPELLETYYNAIMFPVCFMGITSYILIKDKPKKLFAAVFMVGVLYSFAVCFSSNQYFYVIFPAFTISNVASFVFIGAFIKELKEEFEIKNNKNNNYKIILCTVLLITTVCLQNILEITVKYQHCFFEPVTVQQMNSKIECGPAKGIYTNLDNYNVYNQAYNDIANYKNMSQGNILFLSNRCWYYLVAENCIWSTYSTWLSGVNYSAINRLQQYYNLNPEKIPQYIYIEKEEAGELDLSDIYNIADYYGYKISENEISYKLEKIR